MSAETLERLRAAIETHTHLANRTGYATTVGLAHAYLHNLNREATNDN